MRVEKKMTNEKKGRGARKEPEIGGTPQAGTETQTSVESVTLTINDLQLLAQIVDLASQRGAFRAPELEQVGAAYNKLAGFLKYVASVQEKEKQDTEKSSVEE